MIHYDSDTIGRAAPVRDWIAAMEKAFVDTARGVVEVPQRMHLTMGENSLLLMPCFGKKYFSTKLVSVYPGNLKKKKPVISGTVILNDIHTGEPLASFDGSKLTAMRTAAVGSVGIKYLAPQEADRLGIIGVGIQGFHQALFVCQQRRIRQLRILDRSTAIMTRFIERFTAYYQDVEVIPCRNAVELCRDSEIIITATGSRKPVVPAVGKWWKGKTLIGIGSYQPDMREFPDLIFKDLDQVFVDTLQSLDETGDLLVPMQKGIIAREQIFPFSDLLLKKTKAVGDTRFFKSVGMAAFDLYGSRMVFESLT
jgi:ornithine cyclodeaminase/alanine dehydrogenase-like protein (mu-crystallin family)